MRIDLHRHLGGAIKPETVACIGKIPITDVYKQMLYNENDVKTFSNFLHKFDILDKLIWDKQAIARTVQQVCWDIAADKINYCELKLSIARYVRDTGLSPSDVLKFISEVISVEEDKWDIRVPLVLCLKYESPQDQQILFSSVIDDESVRSMVVGIDLVGDESYFDVNFYEPIFKKWKYYGKSLQAHVGESCSAENVRKAINILDVDRVAHGIQAANHKDILDLANEKKICFDIAISSNLYTGVVPSLLEHPIRKMFDYGCDITIGTDDPVIFRTNINNEYRLLFELGFSSSEITKLIDNSIYHASDPLISCLSGRVSPRI